MSETGKYYLTVMLLLRTLSLTGVGIHNWHGTLSIASTLVHGNRAGVVGGGVINIDHGEEGEEGTRTTTITDCELLG